MKVEEKKTTKNMIMLYLMNIAKMIFPLITLPYLTRVLSVDSYGMVSYVKAVMQYAQLFLIFGFTLSATKDIVNANNDKNILGRIVGDVLLAKVILSILMGIFLCVFVIFIDVLNENKLYLFLSYVNIIIIELLADFLFRGLDKMEVITIRFVVSKILSTILIFIFIKSDSDVLFIPFFDIIGSLIAFVLVYSEIRKMRIRIYFTGIRESIKKLKESMIYFISDMSTTAFGAFNTLIIGLLLSSKDVAFWSIVMQLISAVQSMYTPVSNGIYPTMIRTRDFNIILKVFKIFIPIIVVGVSICFVFAEEILLIVGGNKYIGAAYIFKGLLPVLLFSFPAMILGWPTLGAIGKEKETTRSTIFAAVIQVLGIVMLIFCGKLSLLSIAILRGVSEFLLATTRGYLCYKNRNLCVR